MFMFTQFFYIHAMVNIQLPSVHFNTPYHWYVIGIVFSWFLITNPSWVNLPSSRSDPRFASVLSFESVLMLWSSHLVRVEKEWGETSPLLSLPAKAQSLVLDLIWLHHFFMFSHAIPSMEDSSIVFTWSSMVHIHGISCHFITCFVVYSPSLWTHPTTGLAAYAYGPGPSA